MNFRIHSNYFEYIFKQLIWYTSLCSFSFAGHLSGRRVGSHSLYNFIPLFQVFNCSWVAILSYPRWIGSILCMHPWSLLTLRSTCWSEVVIHLHKQPSWAALNQMLLQIAIILFIRVAACICSAVVHGSIIDSRDLDMRWVSCSHASIMFQISIKFIQL
jgi:hypothetical protein